MAKPVAALQPFNRLAYGENDVRIQGLGAPVGVTKERAPPSAMQRDKRLTLDPHRQLRMLWGMRWYVDSRTGDDANDGRGPKTAFKSVQHVIHAAKAGDTVHIAPGAYDQSLPRQISELRAANVVVAVLAGH